MSFACFCVHLAIFEQGRCCHDLDHFLLVLIAMLSVHLILRIYVTGVTAIHPIYIQAVSSQTLTATCLEGPAQIGNVTEILRTMIGKKTWEKQLRRQKKLKKSKWWWCILWCEICCRTSWWKECMGGCSTDTEISLAETCGVALVFATLSASNQAVEGSPWCLDLRTQPKDVPENLWFDFLRCKGHFWCDWIGAWLPLQAWISQIHKFHYSRIVTVWILWIRFDSGNVAFCHARLCTSLDGGNLTGDTGLYIYALWPRLEATLKQCMSLAWIPLCAAGLRQSIHFNLQNWYLYRFWTNMDIISFVPRSLAW